MVTTRGGDVCQGYEYWRTRPQHLAPGGKRERHVSMPVRIASKGPGHDTTGNRSADSSFGSASQSSGVGSGDGRSRWSMMSTGPPAIHHTEALKLECQANDIWLRIFLRSRYFVHRGILNKARELMCLLGKDGHRKIPCLCRGSDWTGNGLDYDSSRDSLATNREGYLGQ